jgi:hypothetical protein
MVDHMENDVEYTPNSVDKLVAALFFLPGLFITIVLLSLFLPPRDDVAARFEFTGLFLAILCLSGMAGCLLRWKATGVLAAAVLALYWVAVGAVCFVILVGGVVFVFLYYGVFTIPAFLIVGLCTKHARRRLKHAWWLGSVVAGFSCGFVGIVVISALARK